jgi:CheY-like chemotaxis protein
MRPNPVVYLVDDDAIYHSITEMLLARVSRPVQFKGFNQGRAAMDQLLKDKDEPQSLPDLILLDINMPIMNGWEFLTEFSSVHNTLSKKPRISMMSSSSLEDDISRALTDQNVMEFVTKPITIEKLEGLTAEI